MYVSLILFSELYIYAIDDFYNEHCEGDQGFTCCCCLCLCHCRLIGISLFCVRCLIVWESSWIVLLLDAFDESCHCATNGPTRTCPWRERSAATSEVEGGACFGREAGTVAEYIAIFTANVSENICLFLFCSSLLDLCVFSSNYIPRLFMLATFSWAELSNKYSSTSTCYVFLIECIMCTQ